MNWRAVALGTIRNLRLATALAAAAMTIAACGSENAPSDPGMFESLLRFVPESRQHSGAVRIIDFKALRDMLEIEAPGPDASDDEVLEYKLTLAYGAERDGQVPIIFGNDWLSGFRRDYIPKLRSTRPYLGFDSRDVDQVVYTGEGRDPSDRGIEVVIGGIRGGVAAELLAACQECVPHEVGSYAGKEFFTWDNDGSLSPRDRRFAAPAHDPFGRGGRILVEEGYAVRALYTDAMHDGIDVISGEAASILNDEDYVLAVRAMDEAGVISMTVTTQPFKASDIIEVFGDRGRLTFDGLDSEWRGGGGYFSLNGVRQPDDTPEAIVTRLFQMTAPLPAYRVVSTGMGSDDDGLFAVIALVFKDEKTAEVGADALNDRLNNGALPTFTFTVEEDEFVQWSDLITNFSVEVNARTAIVRWRPVDPRDLPRMVLVGFPSEGIGFGSNAMFLVAHE
jgi:hypothetical protein